MTKSIVFVHSPLSLEKRYGGLAQAGYTEPPFGLCYLAAVTRQQGFTTSIVDAQALNLDLQETVQVVLDNSPDYVGITITTQLISSAVVVARELKRLKPEIKIIVGGAHVTALPESTIRDNECFDFAVFGEGERTLSQLLEALEEGRDLEPVAGLVMRKSSGDVFASGPRPVIKNLDELPYPAFDLLPSLRKYYRVSTQSVNRLPALSLITSRGCPGKCTFCDTTVHGHVPRAHSARYVAELMTILSKDYGAKSIFFDDDNFLIYKPRLRELIGILEERELDLTWSCMGRVDMVDLETLKIARSGGCWQVMYGIETGSQEILDFYRKNIRLEQVDRALKMTKQAGLKTKGFFMFGNPRETTDTLRNTIDFIQRLPLDDVSISFFTPFPGSEIYDEVDRYGEFDKDWERMSCFDIVFVPHGFTEKELRDWVKIAYRKFYLQPRVLFSYLRRLSSLSQFRELMISGMILLKYIFSRSKRSA